MGSERSNLTDLLLRCCPVLLLWGIQPLTKASHDVRAGAYCGAIFNIAITTGCHTTSAIFQMPQGSCNQWGAEFFIILRERIQKFCSFCEHEDQFSPHLSHQLWVVLVTHSGREIHGSPPPTQTTECLNDKHGARCGGMSRTEKDSLEGSHTAGGQKLKPSLTRLGQWCQNCSFARNEVTLNVIFSASPRVQFFFFRKTKNVWNDTGKAKQSFYKKKNHEDSEDTSLVFSPPFVTTWHLRRYQLEGKWLHWTLRSDTIGYIVGIPRL